MKSVLRLFAIETVLNYVGEYLASTIKNKDSAAARRIIKIVRSLHSVTGTFLNQFGAVDKPEWSFPEE